MIFTDEFLASFNLIKESENNYVKPIGKTLEGSELKFIVEVKPDWDTEMGSCVEFRINETILLLAYITDQKDFQKLLQNFNFG